MTISVDSILSHGSILIQPFEKEWQDLLDKTFDDIAAVTGAKGTGASFFYHPGKNIFVCVMMNDDTQAVDPAMFRFMETVITLSDE